jgi:5-methyltetrahydropteroyltriglutamate--homocysteine methyltransferase
MNESTRRSTPADPPLLPTTVVGSYSVPEWLERLKTDFYLHRISRAHLDEIHDVAIKAAIKDQEQAGIDVVSDGELRRDNDIDYLLARIPGVSILNPAKSYYYDYFEAEVPEPLSAARESSALGLVDDFVFTRSQTDRPIKFSFTGPFSLSRRIRNSAYSDRGELVRSLAYALNVAARELVAAGATRLQIDEPFLAGYPDEVGLAIDAINLVTKDVDADWALHVCYGNRYARPSWEGHYDFLFPAVLDAEVGTLVLEFARKGYEDLSLFARYPWERGLGLGVVDVKSEDVETPDIVAGRIRKALDVVPADRLVINPDCGLRHLPATVARAKLRAMVAAAAAVRRELTGSPVSQQSTATEES